MQNNHDRVQPWAYWVLSVCYGAMAWLASDGLWPSRDWLDQLGKLVLWAVVMFILVKTVQQFDVVIARLKSRHAEAVFKLRAEKEELQCELRQVRQRLEELEDLHYASRVGEITREFDALVAESNQQPQSDAEQARC